MKPKRTKRPELTLTAISLLLFVALIALALATAGCIVEPGAGLEPAREVTIGTYTERLVAVPTRTDTAFYLIEASDTHLERYSLTSQAAHDWAARFGYVIEW